MAIDEGYIKFNLNWEKGPTFSEADISNLNDIRSQLHDKGLVGYYEKLKVGYGNVSQRWKDSNQFIISGTQTGHIARLSPAHYTLVETFNIQDNTVNCKGPIKASSESLTHAVFYQCDPGIQAVLHIHHIDLWKKLLDVVPTSDRAVPYGTPEMAQEVFRLYRESGLAKKKILAMGGHEEGIITFGNSVQEALDVLMTYYN